ncbi:hypothetical protein L3Q82_011354 [Scortum barcoo]|uniref:Uncharacterized protein n=1 Tax=Scortum barcoo TaxID=214431 RepID=A0ACB8WA41_9TELE|nr:hypothetical protein L3Q82_011354 [Scortum barcoo]
MWWLFVVVAVVLVALLITVVVVIKRRRAKGNKSWMNGRVELTSNPAETRSAPETGQDTADPEDGVSYASISFTKKKQTVKPRFGGKTITMKADPEDGVSYTSISFTKKSNSKARVGGEDSIRATTKPTTTTTSEKIKTGTTTTASAINDASTELRGADLKPCRDSVRSGDQVRTWLILKMVFPTPPSASPRRSNSKAKVRRKNDNDEGDAVTYTTVKASSTDPSNLYATVS